MAFYQTQLGKTLPVLWEHEEKDGKMFGFTENYVRVQKPFDASSINQIEMVKLDKKFNQTEPFLSLLFLRSFYEGLGKF